jgi:hypothetical protein
VRRAALALLVLVLPGGAPAATAFPAALAYSRSEAAGGGVFVMARSGRVNLVARGGLSPAWSPDGRRLAFAAPTPNGTTELFVADASGRHRASLTRTPLASENDPGWAPDGRRLVVEREGTLVLVRADGARERPLVAGREPAWAPDGRRIAFVGDRAGSEDVYVVEVSTGRVRPVTFSPGAESAPAWSPDGRRLAFLSSDGLSTDLYVIELSTGFVKRLTADVATEGPPAWSTDGRRVSFVSDRAGVRALWSVSPAGGEAVPLGGPALVERLSWRPPVSRELRPDLDQRAPSDLSLETVQRAGRPRYLLGFESATENRGEGPVSITASRPSLLFPTMQATQRVRLAGGGVHTYSVVGFLRYTFSPTHTHWHLMDFQRYELRRAADHSLVLRDHKSGFCLTDRWSHRIASVPGSAPRPRFTSYCARGRPKAVSLAQGTSVGFADVYPGHVHGQNLDVTRVPAGIYELVHRANPQLLLRELRYENDAASLRIRLSWPKGRAHPPAIRVLRVCAASEFCGP